MSWDWEEVQKLVRNIHHTSQEHRKILCLWLIHRCLLEVKAMRRICICKVAAVVSRKRLVEYLRLGSNHPNSLKYHIKQ